MMTCSLHLKRLINTHPSKRGLPCKPFHKTGLNLRIEVFLLKFVLENPKLTFVRLVNLVPVYIFVTPA